MLFSLKLKGISYIRIHKAGSKYQSDSDVFHSTLNSFQVTRKLACILLIIFSLQAGGWLMLHTVEQYFAQKVILSELNDPDTKFEKLILSVSEYEKGKLNSFEVIHHGKMYDVKSVQFSGDTVVLQVIHDKGEEDVLTEIRKLICHRSAKQSPSSSLLNKIMSVYFCKECLFPVVPFSIKLLGQTLVTNGEKIISAVYAVSTPPPESDLFC